MNELFEHVDQRYAKVCLYAGVTVVITYAAIVLLQTTFPLFNTIWNLVRAVIEPMVYGAALAYILNPLVVIASMLLGRGGFLVGPEKANQRKTASVAIALIIVAIFILAIVAIFVLMITHSLSGLRWESLQSLLDSAQGGFTTLLTDVQERLIEWGVLSSETETTLVSVFNNVRDGASTAIFAIIFGVYFLFDGDRVTGFLARLARIILGGRNIDPTPILVDADRCFSGYFRGQGIDALVVGLSSGIVLTIIGVPYAPLVGLLAGLGNLIPYVGGPVGFASIALMCIADSAWVTMIAGFVAMAVIMFVDANVINPKLLSDNVEVHPILVVAALIAGGVVGGLAGMLVAVPTVAFLKIQLNRWMEVREAALAEAGVISPEPEEHATDTIPAWLRVKFDSPEQHNPNGKPATPYARKSSPSGSSHNEATHTKG